jgi:hypothetical protein
MASIASSLQQQAQELAARTEQLSERTQTVSEISSMLGEIMRAHSLGRQGQELQAQAQALFQRQAQAAATAATDANPASSQADRTAEVDNSGDVEREEEDIENEDEEPRESAYNEDFDDAENALFDGGNHEDEDEIDYEDSQTGDVIEEQAQQLDLSDLVPTMQEDHQRTTLLPSTIPPVANESGTSHCPADDSFWNVPNPIIRTTQANEEHINQPLQAEVVSTTDAEQTRPEEGNNSNEETAASVPSTLSSPITTASGSSHADSLLDRLRRSMSFRR